jgi:hypothetical protein
MHALLLTGPGGIDKNFVIGRNRTQVRFIAQLASVLQLFADDTFES